MEHVQKCDRIELDGDKIGFEAAVDELNEFRQRVIRSGDGGEIHRVILILAEHAKI
jgi:hypothetical protein